MNIAIYTNILTPYRKHFYDVFYNECKRNGDNFHVLVMANTEPGRNWHYSDMSAPYTILLKSKTLSHGNISVHFNKNLISVLKNLDLNILICAGGYLCPGIWTATRYAKKHGIHSVYWSESHLNESRRYSSVKKIIREKIRNVIYKRFDGFWYAGRLSKEFINQYCSSNADFYFMPNLVDEEIYYKSSLIDEEQKETLKMKYHIPLDKVVLFCPARLIEIKGIDKLIPIIGKCQNKEQVVLVVAGDGECKKKIEETSKREKVKTLLLGYQNQENVAKLYSCADIFVLPSLSDANPLTCIEALWEGLPLYISEHCGNYPEVVIEGQNGYVFSYNNIETASIKLEKLINSPKKWRKNARMASHQLAIQKYSTNNVVDSVLNYYRCLCNKEDV